MITIKLSPINSSRAPLEAYWEAPVLTVNGEDYDLSELGDGDEAQHDVLRSVSRNVDDYTVELRLPHGANASHAMRFPDEIVMEVNGVVPVPKDIQEEI